MSKLHNKNKKNLRYFMAYNILFSLFVISCVTPLPQNGSVNIPEDFFGMIGFSAEPKVFDLLDEMEVRWMLRTLYWSRIERERGTFDFSGFDELIDMVNDEGKKIIGILGYEADWLFPEGKDKKYIAPENIPHFLRYVEETVRHFKGRIDVWQIWNEPNLTFWKGSKKDFYELSRLTALKIREIDPDAYIIGGVFVRAPKRFINGMYRAGAMEDLDGLAFHPYAINPWDSMKVYDKFLLALSKINYSKTVWISEIGYPTGGWYPTRVSLKNLPLYLVKTAAGAAARGARVFVWYELFDYRNKGEEDNKWNSEDFFGLVYPNFDRKDGAWAYELCARYLPGSRYTNELPLRENIPASIASFCFLENTSGHNTLILWNDRNRTQTINLQLPVSSLLHDITTGQNRALSSETALDVGKQPLIITWQGAAVPRIYRVK